MSNRDLDLVVRNDEDMERILKFLIFNLKTIDGTRGSALKLLDYMKQ